MRLARCAAWLSIWALSSAWLAGWSAAQDDWALSRERPPATRAVGSGAATAAGLMRILRGRPDDPRALARLAEVKGRAPRVFTEVANGLRAVLAAHPRDVRAARALAQVLGVAVRWDEAVDVLAAVVALDDSGAAALERVKALRARGRLVEARTELESAEARRLPHTTRRAALTALGEVQIELGEIRAAQTAFDALVRERRGDVMDFPRALARFGKHAEAARVLGALVGGAQGAAKREVLGELARASLAAGDADGAVAAIVAARKLAVVAATGWLDAIEREAYRAAGRSAELAAVLEERAQRGDSEAWLWAARVWEELGDARRAVASYRARLVRVPADLRARAALATQLVRAGEVAAAERELRGLVRRAPGEPRYWTELASLLHAAGRGGEALAVLDEQCGRAPQAVEVRRAAYTLYTRWGERARAERELEVLARLEPGAADIAAARAEGALSRGDRAAAVAALGAGRGGRDSAVNAAARARALADHDLLPEAIADARRALSFAPGEPAHRRLLAELLERVGEHAEVEALIWPLMNDPSVDDALRRELREQLVRVWRRLGRMRVREVELREAVRARPDDLEPLRLLAALHAHESEKRDDELAELAELSVRAPGDLEALRLLARAQARRGGVGAACAIWGRLLRSGGGTADVSEALALASAHPDESEVPGLVELALSRAPDDARVLRAASALLRRRGEGARARALLARVVALAPADYEARLALAREDWARGARAEALEQLHEALSARDERVVRDAARWLLQHDGDLLEERLLELTLRDPARVVQRALLLELLVRALGPLAARTVSGEASAAERAALERGVDRVRGPVVAALAGGAGERGGALSLLAAVAVDEAGAALLALAAADGLAMRERALALVALGRLTTRAYDERLVGLYASLDRRLRPHLLWALAQRGGPGAALVDDALASRDAGIATMARLVGAARPSTPIGSDAPAVRAAALWVRARGGDARRDALAQAAGEPAPVGLVAVDALATQLEDVARALLADDVEVRRHAARLLAFDRGRRDRLPAPAYPFDPVAYVTRLVVDPAGSPAPTSLSARWPSVIDAVSVRLVPGAIELAHALALSASPGGLVPTAFVEVGACVPEVLAEALAEAVRARLTMLTQVSEPGVARRALDLLVRGGGAADPAVEEALRSDEHGLREVALDALATLPRLPASLVAPVRRLMQGDQPWPTRRRAARALGPDAIPAMLVAEPMALVRAAARAPRPMPAAGCAAISRAAPN